MDSGSVCTGSGFMGVGSGFISTGSGSMGVGSGFISTGSGSMGAGSGSIGAGSGSIGAGSGSISSTGSGLSSSPDVTTISYIVLVCEDRIIPRLSCKNMLILPERSSSKGITILSKRFEVERTDSRYDTCVSDMIEEKSHT